MLSMVKGFGSRVLGVAAPALCVEGGSGEMGSGIFCVNTTVQFVLMQQEELQLSLRASDIPLDIIIIIS